jgi:hypothetical protein
LNLALRKLPALANKILVQRGGNLFAATSSVAVPNPQRRRALLRERSRPSASAHSTRQMRKRVRVPFRSTTPHSHEIGGMRW